MSTGTDDSRSHRVILATDFYPPFVGGAERQVQLLARALAVRGHDVAVATVWHDGLPEVEEDDGITVYRLRSKLLEQSWFSGDPVRRFHPPFPVAGIVGGLRSLIADRRATIVNANGWIAYSCAAAVADLPATQLIISVRDYGHSCAVRTLMHYERRVCSGPAPSKCLKCAAHHYGIPKAIAAVAGVSFGRLLLERKVQAIHVVSEYVGSIVQRDLIGPEPGNWRPPVVRIPDIPPSPSIVGVVDDQDIGAGSLPTEPFILYVGQLQKHKGIYWLMDAYSRLTNPPPLVMIGTVWPDTPKEFPPGVVMLGEAPHRLVLLAWQRSLFGIVPSIWPDPLPGVVREGMSQGKAVIGSAIGGILDMIQDGQTGLLVAPGDVPGLMDAMSRLIDDPALRDRLGAAAQETTRPITADYVATRFEQLYSGLPGASPTNSR